MASVDDFPIDGMDSEEIERIQREWGLDAKQAKALEYIRKGLPLKSFTHILSQELWVREILKDLESNKCRACKRTSGAARSKALDLFGQWIGAIGNKAHKKSSKEVRFEE